MQHLLTHDAPRVPWNKGKLTGQKPPLKRNEIWAIRVRLQIRRRVRDLALFNLAIDSKLRACDLVRIRVRDVTQGSQIASRAIVIQRKTKRPVQFEISDQSRMAISKLIELRASGSQDYLFSSREISASHLSTRQYAKLLKDWVVDIGLDPSAHDKIQLIFGDLLDQNSLITALQESKPDEVYNLAAQSFVPTSWNQARAHG